MKMLYIDRIILLIIFLVFALMLESCSNCSVDGDQRYSDYYDGCMNLGNNIIKTTPDKYKQYNTERIFYHCTIEAQRKFSEELPDKAYPEGQRI